MIKEINYYTLDKARELLSLVQKQEVECNFIENFQGLAQKRQNSSALGAFAIAGAILFGFSNKIEKHGVLSIAVGCLSLSAISWLNYNEAVKEHKDIAYLEKVENVIKIRLDRNEAFIITHSNKIHVITRLNEIETVVLDNNENVKDRVMESLKSSVSLSMEILKSRINQNLVVTIKI